MATAITTVEAGVPTLVLTRSSNDSLVLAITNSGSNPVWLTDQPAGFSADALSRGTRIAAGATEKISIGRTLGLYAYSPSGTTILTATNEIEYSSRRGRAARVAYSGTSIMVGSSNGAGGGAFRTSDLRAVHINMGGHLAFHIQRNLGLKAICVAMAATGGSYIAQANNVQANPWLEWQIPRVIANAPDFCFVNTGTNEMGGAALRTTAEMTLYEGQLRGGLAQLLAAGITPILMSIPPRSANANENTNVVTWNQIQAKVAASMGIPFVNFWRYVTGSNGAYLTNLSTEGTPIHPDGTGLRACVDAMAPEFTSLFSAGVVPQSHSNTRSTAASPTDNLIPGIFDGVASSIPTNWSRVAGADGNVTIASWAPSGASAAGQTFVGNGMKLTSTAQYTARSSVQDVSTQTPAGTLLQFGGWLALPTNANSGSLIGALLQMLDAGGTVVFRSALMRGVSGTYATPAYLAIEHLMPATDIAGSTPVTQLAVDIGHHAAVTANGELQLGHLSLRVA